MVDTEIKPCPHCGGEGILSNDEEVMSVDCTKCSASGPWFGYDVEEKRELAVLAWNERSQTEINPTWIERTKD